MTAPPIVSAPDTTPTPAPSAADALKSASSWDQVRYPNAPADAGGNDVVDTDAIEVADAPLETPDSVPSPDEGPEFSQDESGRWHRADGTMASVDEIAQITAQLADAPATETPDAPNPENVVTLRRRDGTTRDVQVDDPELAQEIRQNMNDGMRKREHTEAMASIASERAEFAEFRTLMRTNPEGVILNYLPPEKQISIAAKLLATHFDQLVPIINGYAENPQGRITAVAESARQTREQEQQYHDAVSSQRAASAVKQATVALIPETATEDMSNEFMEMASLTLIRALDNGQQVTPENTPALLSKLAQRFGFSGAASAAPALAKITSLASNTAAGSSPAQPANAAAKALQETQTTQRRIRLNQQLRSRAAAVPPAGAGAPPTHMPAVPKGSTIEQASQRLKARKSW